MRKGGQYRADDDGKIVKVESAADRAPSDVEHAAPTEAPTEAPVAADTTSDVERAGSPPAARSRRDRNKG